MSFIMCSIMRINQISALKYSHITWELKLNIEIFQNHLINMPLRSYRPRAVLTGVNIVFII